MFLDPSPRLDERRLGRACVGLAFECANVACAFGKTHGPVRSSFPPSFHSFSEHDCTCIMEERIGVARVRVAFHACVCVYQWQAVRPTYPLGRKNSLGSWGGGIEPQGVLFRGETRARQPPPVCPFPLGLTLGLSGCDRSHVGRAETKTMATMAAPRGARFGCVRARYAPCWRARRDERTVTRRVEARAFGGMNKDQMGKMKEAYEQAMKDPEKRAQMEQMQQELQSKMKEPGFMDQMKAMQEQMKEMQKPEVQERLKELQQDPELQEFFTDIRTNGPMAVQKYMTDPKILEKFKGLPGFPSGGPPGAAAEAPAEAPAAAAEPSTQAEISNLLEAAKFGDVEAVEDLVAVGKDPNESDEEGRTPLHYACAYDHVEVLEELMKGGADVEKTDSKGNTALHYAAGYARANHIKVLVGAGASKGVKNLMDKTPLELIQIEPRNPLNEDEEVLQLLA